MKKTTYMLALLMWVLGACSSAPSGPPTVSDSPTRPLTTPTLIPLSTSTPESVTTEAPAPPASLQPGELPVSLQLIIGTFKLDGTAQAVTAEQAADLQPLWQSYKELSENSTTTQEQIDGLTRQIEAAMTPEQIQTIAQMQLTQQDVFTTLQEQGISIGGPGDQGQNFTPEMIATIQARRAQAGGSDSGSNRMLPLLVDGLIKYLQSKAGG